jgi:hypothetical protein
MEDGLENTAAGTTEDQDRYQRAKARVAALRGFYKHLMVYMMVNGGLIVLSLIGPHGGYWWSWSALFWGIGLAAHAASVFVCPGFLDKEWEERKIREIMAKRA